MASITDMHRERARKLQKTIVLPEAAADARTMKAARMFLDDKLGIPLVLGSDAELQASAAKAGVSLDGIKTLDINKFDRLDEMIKLYQERRAKENLTPQQARAVLDDPLYFGAMLVRMSIADGMTAGALNTTANVIRASIKCIGPRKGLKTVSSSFLMIVPDCPYGEGGAFIYSDCGVIPAPTFDQLVDIGDAAADTFKALVGAEPIVAYLSFSTKGSAEHEDAKKMADAAATLAARRPELMVDGELSRRCGAHRESRPEQGSGEQGGRSCQHAHFS